MVRWFNIGCNIIFSMLSLSLFVHVMNAFYSLLCTRSIDLSHSRLMVKVFYSLNMNISHFVLHKMDVHFIFCLFGLQKVLSRFPCTGKRSKQREIFIYKDKRKMEKNCYKKFEIEKRGESVVSFASMYTISILSIE